jgi:hypothetical protein
VAPRTRERLVRPSEDLDQAVRGVGRMGALKVTPISDGGYVVRGTLDRYKAKRAVQRYRMTKEGEPPRYAVNIPPLVRAGLFRWNPCSPNSCWDGGTHIGHIDYCDQRGPGVWQGVYFH